MKLNYNVNRENVIIQLFLSIAVSLIYEVHEFSGDSLDLNQKAT